MSTGSQNNELDRLTEENRRLAAALARAQDELQRRQASDAALRAKLQVVAQTARMWAWESDIKGNYIWDINRPSEMGLDDVALAELGARYFAMIEPADLEQIFANHFIALQSKSRLITHRYRVRYPDGSTRHLEGRGAFLYDAADNPTGIVGVTLDVSSDVHAAQALRQQTAELREAQRRMERASLSSQEGHWELDVASGRTWVSSSFCELLGYAPESIDLSSREKYLELVHPDDRAIEVLAFSGKLHRNKPIDMEIRMRPASGDWRWMRLRGMAEVDANGQPVTVAGSIHDIHEMKLAEDDLRLVRQRFERAIRGTQDGLWEWDILHDTFWVSPRYENILGYEEGTMPDGTDFRKAITHPDDLAQVAAVHEAHFAHNAPLDLEVRVRHKKGHYIWMRARGEAERDVAGRPIRVAGSIQDVTEAVLAREALIQATEAAQAANRAKSDFLANVSHEIRTPMNGIIGMTTLLLDTGLNRTQLEYAETIRSSADSLLVVINDILDFSKIEAGKLDVETIELDLRRSVEDVGAMMAIQASAKNLELIVNIRPEVPEQVIGDPQRIRQCLINLVGNAVKFTPSGEIVIEVGVVGRQDGKVLTHFEVRDTGIGIAPEVAKNLFQPFVQADSSTTRHFGGTGLGLSIVRRLVEMMGGKVGMESRPGQGSTFWFMLPLRTEEPAGLQLAAAPATGRRVLVIDDNRTLCEVVASLLDPAGYRVSMAGDAAQAVAMMKQAVLDDRAFDVALIDCDLIGLDSSTLLDQIKSDPLLARTQAVLMTSLDRQDDRKNFANRGFAAYLSKPVRVRELLGCIERVLSAPTRPAAVTIEGAARNRQRDDAAVKEFSAQILVVEDNPVNQKVAQRFLERLGCSVTIADNGAKAVTVYPTNRFDLVLMDLQMPVMDGYEATRQIRAMEKDGKRTPIMALTANAMTGQLERCLASDMDGLLTKPLSVDRLKETLERLGLKRSADEGAAALR